MLGSAQYLRVPLGVFDEAYRGLLMLPQMSCLQATRVYGFNDLAERCVPGLACLSTLSTAFPDCASQSIIAREQASEAVSRGG